MAETIRVLIADDHQLVREGLRTMIDGEEGIQVVGEASNGEEALAAAKELNPALVLMDIRMPKVDGLEATRLMKELCPNVSVVMISVYDNDAYIVDAIRAGAAGYLLKDVSRDLLIHTIKAVNAGGIMMKPSLLRRALDCASEARAEEKANAITLTPEVISGREKDVLKLLVEGLTNKQIGVRLSLSGDTVKKHVQNLIGKLQATDRTQAAVKAVRAGLVPLNSKSGQQAFPPDVFTLT